MKAFTTNEVIASVQVMVTVSSYAGSFFLGSLNFCELAVLICLVTIWHVRDFQSRFTINC